MQDGFGIPPSPATVTERLARPVSPTMSSDPANRTRSSALLSQPPQNPNPLTTLLALARDIFDWALYKGTRHISGRPERSAGYDQMRNEFNLRLRPAATAACGVVPLGSPAFPELEQRVERVRESCFQLLRYYNPHEISESAALDAAAEAISALERAVIGHRLSSMESVAGPDSPGPVGTADAGSWATSFKSNTPSCPPGDPTTTDQPPGLAEFLSLREAELPAVKTGASGGRGKGKHIDARMLKVLQDDPEPLWWPAQKWAKVLGCSKATVVESRTWKEKILVARAIQAAERVSRTGQLDGGRRRKAG